MNQTISMVAYLVVMVAIFYFVLIRPQKKKEKQTRDMLAALKIGDEVASIGGIHGKITRIKDEIFVLETGVGTTKSYISIERAAISRLIKAGNAVDAVDEAEVAPIPDDIEE